MPAELVSVVVPAYNAARTIDETLRSIRYQSHAHLEILVVDDGSTDDTAAIVLAQRAVDPRVRLIRQENAGVAAARNRGIREATAELVAPVDADDLWAPTKIEEQVRVMRQGGPQLGLVYTWSVPIDIDSFVIGAPEQHDAQGDVLGRMCRANLVGNGSAALIRKQALVEAGGYDSELRTRGAEGCEDIALYIRVAEAYRFGLVPKPLTGYRQRPDSMSSDGYRMYRSWLIVARQTLQRQPQCKSDLESCTSWMAAWALSSALRTRRFGAIVTLTARHPMTTIRKSVKTAARRLLGPLRAPGRSRGGTFTDGIGGRHRFERFVIGSAAVAGASSVARQPSPSMR